MNSSQLKGYLTGLILGDGFIDKGVTKRSFRIKSINFDFIESIENNLNKNTNFSVVVKEYPATFKEGIQRQPYKELKILKHPYFAKKYHHFYDDYRNRRITTEVLNWLNPQGLANWYMSDGYVVHVGKTKGKIVDRRVELCTDRYSLEDVHKVKNYLENTYGYKIKIVDRKRNDQYRLRISLLDAQNFFVMIKPFITPSMLYKLNLKYDNRPKWMSDDYFNLMNEITECEALNV